MIIREMLLYSHDLALSKAFYAERLGLSVIEETDNTVSFEAGDAALTFRRSFDGEQPYYHFALKISENKWEAAMKWLEQRDITLTTFSGERKAIHFQNWNSHSYYFFDLTGNIVELIAKHDIPSSSPADSPFSSEDITGIGEIGMAAADARELADEMMRACSLPEYLDADDLFVPVGDPYGLFIVSSVKRRWLGSDKPCAVYPLEAVIQGPAEAELRLNGYPYVIRQTAL